MTITLAAVYAPIGFAQGLTGALFREFAVTLAGAVIISGFIALTLSPMLAARVLKPHGASASRFQRIVDRSFDRVSEGYGRRVASTLNYRCVTLMIVAALSATMVFLFLNTSSELAPEEDIGFMFSIVNAPAYATSNYTEAFVKDVTKATEDVPEVNVRFSVVGFGGTNQAFAGFGLKPLGRARPQPGGDPAGRAGADRQGRRRAGLRLRAADAARHRRRPAGAVHPPLDRRSGPGLRGRRGDQEPRAGERPLHRRAELARRSRSRRRWSPSTATAPRRSASR